jgi:hypothetical protein
MADQLDVDHYLEAARQMRASARSEHNAQLRAHFEAVALAYEHLAANIEILNKARQPPAD